MLTLQSWLPAAQELTLGQRIRVPHDCGDGRVLLVEHKDDCWSAWCHRCSDKGWHPKPTPSLAERLAKLKTAISADDEAATTVAPPMPAEFNPSLWPDKARVWLYKAGLSNERIMELGFYWNPAMRRVVMPVFNDRVLVYWQARAFDDRPKYINPPVAKPLYKQGSGNVLVLTEDILSAARVGEVTAAWSILGTSADDSFITEIVATGLPVRVWLDPDKAGLKGRRKLVPKLRAYGVDATAVKADLDPKFYSKQEILQFL
jgi:hypothetical protein